MEETESDSDLKNLSFLLARPETPPATNISRVVFGIVASAKDEWEKALSKLKSLETTYNELKDEIKQYVDNDPAAFEAMKESINVSYSVANRWTDNIFTLREWYSNNFPQAKEQPESLYTEGLITKERQNLDPATAPFARNPVEINGFGEEASLLEVVKKVKPHVLLGLSGVGGIFTEEVLRTMRESDCPKPAIFAMSNPTTKGLVWEH